MARDLPSPRTRARTAGAVVGGLFGLVILAAIASVPVLHAPRAAWLVLVALVALRAFGPSASLLRGPLELRGDWQVAQVTYWAVVLGAVAGRVLFATLVATPDHLGLSPWGDAVADPMPPWPPDDATMSAIVMGAGAGTAATLVLWTVTYRPTQHAPSSTQRGMPWPQVVFGIVAGASLAAVVLVAAMVVGTLLGRAVGNVPVPLGPFARIEIVAAAFPQSLTGLHITNVVLGATIALVWAGAAFFDQPASLPSRPWHRHADSATLAYVLQLLLLTCLMGGFVTYVLDRIGLGWVAAALLGFAAMAVAIRRHHVHPIAWHPDAAPDTALAMQARVARAPVVDGHRRLVVLMAHGGGVQAAAWTTRVVRGMVDQLDDKGKDFLDSVVLTSSVSGGTHGVARLLEALVAPDQAKALHAAERRAQTPTLDGIAWAWIRLDLMAGRIVRALTRRWSTLPRHADRGWLLEQEWIAASGGPEGAGRADAPIAKPLSWWAGLVGEGRVPLFAFNTTRTEDGHRFVVSPLPLATLQRTAGCRDLFDGLVDPKRAPSGRPDLPMVTAVRLSAAFPFATPLSVGVPAWTIDPDAPRPAEADAIEDAWRSFHVGDGGYYDNSGFLTASQLVADVVLPAIHAVDAHLEAEGGDRPRTTIDLVELDAFPSHPTDDQATDGWFAAIAGPLQTLYNMRTAGYLERNAYLTQLLVDAQRSDVDIRRTVARFPRLPADDATWDANVQRIPRDQPDDAVFPVALTREMAWVDERAIQVGYDLAARTPDPWAHPDALTSPTPLPEPDGGPPPTTQAAFGDLMGLLAVWRKHVGA